MTSMAVPFLPPRLTAYALPAEAYVPGRSPRGAVAAAIGPHPAVAGLAQTHRWAIDLFNHGYYWEAHEAWESIWIALGRRGSQADFIKGLIKLTAAGVKLRQRRPRGAVRHARRAAELFAGCARIAGAPGVFPGELSPWYLAAQCLALAERPPLVAEPVGPPQVVRVMPFVLW